MNFSSHQVGSNPADRASAILAFAVLILPLHSAFAKESPTTADVEAQLEPGPAMQSTQSPHTAGMHEQTPPTDGTAPSMPGQDAFGATQEIVRILEADPTTDWSKVNLEALRQHLIDMNEVTLKADAATKPIDGGIEIAVTGGGRTLAAIQRMVPAHAHELNRLNGWKAGTQLLPDGVRLTVTSTNPKEMQHIRGLGFIGLLVSGSHHQPHHLAIARGERIHQH